MEWWIILIIVFASLLLVGLLLYLLKWWLRRARYRKQNNVPNHVVVITGANTGIGKETAIDLASRGMKVYIACRDITRGQNAQKEIIQKSGNENVHFLQLDLASLESIREFSRRFHQIENQLHVLICNAGVMTLPFSHTQDGFEMQIGVNHIGHFLLTVLLLDLLKVSAPSRIIVVSSIAHQGGVINREDLMSEKSYNKYKAYAQSKLANILFVHELAKRLEGTGVTANSCHPGVVHTELGRYLLNPTMQKYVLEPILTPFLKTPLEGAQTQIMLAVDPDLEKVTGKYFDNCKEAAVSKEAKDDDTAAWLWDRSEVLTNAA